jgi:hypothetical protein
MKNLSLIVLFAAIFAAGTATAAPTLNSYPTAAATIYIDFDGHDVNSSMWNYGTPFSCLPAAMTDAQITEAFNRIAEDFRPFNINVTTDLSKFLAAPLSQRIRVVVTPTSAWYAGVAGIAYVTSFTWGDDTPAFVFSDRLGNNAKKVAEAVSHETGHTLGLYHQSAYTSTCTLTSSYHTGIGTGETSWGPIMGNVASRNATQWNFGPTPNGCAFLQDNLSIITTTNGFGYRPDDYADLYTSASPLVISNNVFSKAGVISTTADKDYFRLDLSLKGALKLNVTPYNVGTGNSGANLDVKIILQDAKGIEIRTFDIADSMHARIDTTLAAGTYYVIVDGTGNVNAGNDYGSLGAYTIDGTYAGTTVTTTTVTTTSSSNNAVVTGIKVKNGNKLNWNPNSLKGTTAISVMVETQEGDFKEIARPALNANSYVHEVNTPAAYTYMLKFIEKDGSVQFSNRVTIENKNDGTGIFKVIKQAQQPVIVNAAEAYEYQVVDNFGNVVLAGKATAGTKTIDVRNQPAGLYNLRLLNGTENRTEKFMNR